MRFDKLTLSARFLLNYILNDKYELNSELYAITQIDDIVTHEQLLKVLEYDPNTGIFKWKESRGPKSKGSIAGTMHHTGYRYIEINNKPYAEHRLAWFYINKSWPVAEIDHIDRIKDNNKLINLRDVSHSINMKNRVMGY